MTRATRVCAEIEVEILFYLKYAVCLCASVRLYRAYAAWMCGMNVRQNILSRSKPNWVGLEQWNILFCSTDQFVEHLVIWHSQAVCAFEWRTRWPTQSAQKICVCSRTPRTETTHMVCVCFLFFTVAHHFRAYFCCLILHWFRSCCVVDIVGHASPNASNCRWKAKNLMWYIVNKCPHLWFYLKDADMMHTLQQLRDETYTQMCSQHQSLIVTSY